MGNIVEITDSQFEAEVIQSAEPVLVDFFATWCPPCQRLAAILEEMAPDYDGRIKFVKINTDNEPQWAGKLGVRGLPTVAYFKGGEPVTVESGLPRPDKIKSHLESML